jgi:hypothetical protein
MIRQTPSRRLRIVVVATAGAGMLATAALAATYAAPNGSYGKLPGYGGYGRAASSTGDFGSGSSSSSGSGYSDPSSSSGSGYSDPSSSGGSGYSDGTSSGGSGYSDGTSSGSSDGSS